MKLICYRYTLASLKTSNCTKLDLFPQDIMEGMGYRTYDYALPQQWLDEFADYCREHYTQVTYNLILSSCVWAYGDTQGPVTCCYEVMVAFWMWQCSESGGEMPRTALDAKRHIDAAEIVKEIKQLERKLAQLTDTNWACYVDSQVR